MLKNRTKQACRLMNRHKAELDECEHVTVSYVPKTGHGLDISILTERHGLLVIAEVTGLGAGATKLKMGTRQELVKKVTELARVPACNRYVLVGSPVVKAFLENRPEVQANRIRVIQV